MQFELPANVLQVIKRFSEAGFRVDAVGGCVRDMMMGIKPHDFDMTTDAFPDEMKRVLAGERIIETGLKHGTLTLLLNGEPFEITTYRVDGAYADHRHPEKVTFTRSLREDLARRDFTVNAMAYHPEFGLTDYFGGREDVEGKVIRAVGDAETRFREDALRILRALRFSSRLGFAVEEKTALAIHGCRRLLADISAERIDSEWKGILAADGCCDVITAFPDVIETILPEFKDSILKIVTKIDNRQLSPEDRMIAMCSCLPDAVGIYRSAMERLRADNVRKKDGVDILTEMTSSFGQSDGELLRSVYRIGEKNALRMLRLRETLGEGEPLLSRQLESLLRAGKCTKNSDLALKGNDLAALGFHGKEIGEKMEFLLFSVMDGKVANDKQALLRFVTE